MSARKIIANKKNRFWLTIFSLISLSILLGVLYLVLPKVEFIITPQKQNISLAIPVKINLETSESFFNLSVIPGKVLAAGESLAKVEQQGNRIINVGGMTITYKLNEYRELVIFNIQKNVPQGWVVLDPESNWPEAEWQISESGKQVDTMLEFDKQIIQNFPWTSWQEKIVNLPLTKAVEWLSAKPGIQAVDFIYYPSFLANISKKVPRFLSRIKFSLDI